MTAHAHRLWTADELFEHASRLGRCELVRGEVIQMPPAGGEHGEIAANVLTPMTVHVKARKLGRTYGAETGFILTRNPDTVRAPDAAFVSAARLPDERIRKFVPFAPDFAVEVVSPDDRLSEVAAKVQEWLAAGCRLVWVADPRTRTVTAYYPDRSARVHHEQDTIDAGDAVPDFRMSVAEVFE